MCSSSANNELNGMALELITTFDTNDFKLPWLSGYFILYLLGSINLKSLSRGNMQTRDEREPEEYQ